MLLLSTTIWAIIVIVIVILVYFIGKKIKDKYY
jgi:uncharacterized membrane protein